MRSAAAIVVFSCLLAGAAGSVAGADEQHPPDLVPGVVAPIATDAQQVWIAQPVTTDLVGLLDVLASAGLTHHGMPLLGMATFLGDADDAKRVAAAGARVEANERLDLHLDRTVPYVEADSVRRAVGSARGGPVVLVVDTGIDSAHPDFRNAMEANIQPQVQGGLVIGDLAQLPVVDPAGHGTHVGGIVAASGQGFGDGGGKYQGVYSNGRVASYQVTLDAPGSADPQVDTAAALQAFEWALANRARHDLAVVTNSWGAPGPFDPGAAVNQATLRLYQAGMVVVFSAGNEGRDGEDTLNKYCMAPWVLCVAAGDLGGARASFSSIGSSDRPYKHPDLTAPGTQVMSAHPVSGLGSNLRTGTASSSLYSERSGTSMAAPHVAAAAALLLAGNPELSPDQLMDILVATTDPMADDVVRVGTGYMNVRQAYNLAIGTPGTRDSFLDGHVKYAGRASGDSRYALDPVSVGFDGSASGTVAIPPPREDIWLTSSLVAWVLAGLVVVSLASGIQWRSSRPPARNRAIVRPAAAPAPTDQVARRTGPIEKA